MKTFFSLLLAILFSGSSFAQYSAEDYGLCIDGPCDHSYSLELDPVESYVSGNTMLFSTTFSMTDSNEPIYLVPSPRVGVSIDGETYYNKTLSCGGEPYERTCWQDFTVPLTALGDLSNVDSVYVRLAVTLDFMLPDTAFSIGIYKEPFMFPNSSMVTGTDDDVDEELFAIKMYPNPTTSSVTIETPGSNESVVEILDLAGKRVAISDHTTSITTIDVSEFVSGIYLVKVTTENSEVFIERLLVQ